MCVCVCVFFFDTHFACNIETQNILICELEVIMSTEIKRVNDFIGCFIDHSAMLQTLYRRIYCVLVVMPVMIVAWKWNHKLAFDFAQIPVATLVEISDRTK